MNHTTGKKPFAVVRDKLTKDTPHSPIRVELFGKVYSHSNGRPSHNLVAEKLSKMKEKISELPPDHEDVVSRDDVFSQIMGRDKSGYVRLYGDGVQPNDTWSKIPNRNTLIRDNIQQREKLKTLEEKLEEQATVIARMVARLEQRCSNESSESQRNMCVSSSNNVSTRGARSSNGFRVGREVMLKSFPEAKNIVARGYIRSMDPLAFVHGCQLGPNWFEVEIKAAINGDERLVRPYYSLETILDALGANIAWPEHLMSVYTED